MEIDKLIVDLSTDPFNAEKNFKAALEYDKLNQTASAISFYLRAAEYGNKELDSLIIYTSLLRISLCFEKQGDRQATVLNNALQAAAFLTNRPEAYFLLSRIYERSQQWQSAYTFSCLGLKNLNDTLPPLPASVEYYGPYCLLFEKAVSGWWLGKNEESKQLFLKLNQLETAPEYTIAIKNNLERLNIIKNNFINPLEPVVTNFRKFFGMNADTIIDLGSRDGEDAYYLSKELYGKKVYAIDANPDAIDIMTSRYPWMQIRYCAISDSNGETTFQRVRDADASMVGCSSIYANKVANEPQFEGKVDLINVPLKTMQTFMSEESLEVIDIIKVDTEGYTWQVLQGFGDKLNNVRLLHLETEKEPTHAEHKNNQEVAEFMVNNGFKLVDLSYEGSGGINGGIEDQVWINSKLILRNKDYFIS